MKETNRFSGPGFLSGLLLLATTLLLVSCATVPELQLLYRPGAPSKQIHGKKVSLKVVDERSSKEVLGAAAKEEFEGFSGNISLSIPARNDKELRIGIFNVPDLIEEAVRIKLKGLGVTVLTGSDPDTPELVIAVKEFLLDLEGWKWVARMSYEARIRKGGRVLATRTVNGRAERFRSLSRESADALMGEVFTDTVNALDLPKLLAKAGL